MSDIISWQLRYDQAHALGHKHGRSAGSWVIDGNTSEGTARSILDGIEAGDPMIMAMEPSPLSGEWADGPSLSDILDELDTNEDDDAADDLLNAYEEGFSEGFWTEVQTSASYITTESE